VNNREQLSIDDLEAACAQQPKAQVICESLPERPALRPGMLMRICRVVPRYLTVDLRGTACVVCELRKGNLVRIQTLRVYDPGRESFGLMLIVPEECLEPDLRPESHAALIRAMGREKPIPPTRSEMYAGGTRSPLQEAIRSMAREDME
jgi:hypothetical protein